MRTYLATALVASLMFTGSAIGLAAQAPKTAPAAKPAHVAAEKTAMGTVKSIDAKMLVLKTKKGDMSFTLDTAPASTITTGSNVTVHYKTEGKTMVATGVMVQPAAPKKH